MAYSKVILNGVTLMDVTQDTVDAANLLSGETATKNSGAKVTGTYTPPTFSTQSKTVSPSTTSQTVQPDSGYDGLSSVTVNAMPSGSASTPATRITANPSISVSSGGLITATASASQNVTPTVSAGYVSSGTAGSVTVSGSNTQQLTTQAAQTITPTTTNQTIASGKYLTGAQTILGDANLLPENIKKDVSIFNVVGTLEGGGGMPYDIVLHCTNANGFTNNASDYVWEVGDIISLAYKAVNGDPLTGIAYALVDAYDDEENMHNYTYDVLPLQRIGVVDYGGGEFSDMTMEFASQNCYFGGNGVGIRQYSLSVRKSNEDPDMPADYTYASTYRSVS